MFDTDRAAEFIKNMTDNFTFTMDTVQDYANKRCQLLTLPSGRRGRKLSSTGKEEHPQENTNIASLSHDLNRRLKHASLTLPIGERIQVV